MFEPAPCSVFVQDYRSFFLEPIHKKRGAKTARFYGWTLSTDYSMRLKNVSMSGKYMN
jgi:hypothetical protein